MRGPRPASYDYAIGDRDQIISVSPDWIGFARENGAAGLDASAVLGRSIFEFIRGESTQAFYGVLFRRVRGDRTPLTLPFRCDSPDRFRFMELAIAPGEDAVIELRGVLLREQERPHCRLVDTLIPRSEVELDMCSVCTRVRIPGSKWLEVDEAIASFDLFDSVEQPRLRYSVCESCTEFARVNQGVG